MIQENIRLIREKIANACGRSGRSAQDVTLIAVTKTVPGERVKEALTAGVRDIGESRIQEAQEKFLQLAGSLDAVRKHLIGHLQTNKAKKAVELFDLIHSVDSVRLAEELDRQASRAGKVQECLLEVNVSGEESKFGAPPEEVPGLVVRIRGMKNLRLRGMMTMAPFAADPEAARPYFKRAKTIFDAMRAADPEMAYLSMGMSGDFEVAVEEGATLVRVGTAIFGDR